MTIYYKYYSYLPLEYFDKPNIKVASPLHLNDPFESLIPTDIKKQINSFANSFYKNNPSDNKVTKEGMIRSMNSVTSIYGITSLSETQRSLLMWAHYANNHKGLCIGYDAKTMFFEDDKNKKNDDFTIRKVKYNNIRHDFYGDFPETSVAKELAEYLLYNVMLTKGDDWIYEKEYRYIIAFHRTHFLTVDHSKKNRALEKSIEKMIEMDVIKKENENENKYVRGNGQLASAYGILGKFKEASYFLNINPKSIKSIYFGCKADRKYINSIKKLISDINHPLHHVKVQKFKLSQYKFEIST